LLQLQGIVLDPLKQTGGATDSPGYSAERQRHTSITEPARGERQQHDRERSQRDEQPAAAGMHHRGTEGEHAQS
jgi:hypothetical protein